MSPSLFKDEVHGLEMGTWALMRRNARSDVHAMHEIVPHKIG